MRIGVSCEIFSVSGLSLWHCWCGFDGYGTPAANSPPISRPLGPKYGLAAQACWGCSQFPNSTFPFSHLLISPVYSLVFPSCGLFMVRSHRPLPHRQSVQSYRPTISRFPSSLHECNGTPLLHDSRVYGNAPAGDVPNSPIPHTPSPSLVFVHLLIYLPLFWSVIVRSYRPLPHQESARSYRPTVPSFPSSLRPTQWYPTVV